MNAGYGQPFRPFALPDGRVVVPPEYGAWGQMIQRTTNPKNKDWDLYGGRGITVCMAWRCSFDKFLFDVGPKPEPHHEYCLDRLDNSRGYEPGNVAWVTWSESNRNRRPWKIKKQAA